MTRFRRGMTIVTLCVALPGAVMIAGQRTADVALRAAIEAETVRGDVRGAIEQYKRVVETYGNSDRAISAQALLRLAEAYRKLGDAEAKSVYERITRDFADQTTTVREARSRLAALGESERSQTGLTARQIWTGPRVDASGTVSRDGKYLSYTDWETGDLAIRDLTAGSSRRLTNTGGWAASGDYTAASVISADGRQIAYNWFVQQDFKNELRILPASATQTTRPLVILRSDRNDYFVPFGWTADGAQLAVVRSAPDRNTQLGFVSVKSGSFRSVKSLEWRYPNQASLSPDGRYIAYDVPAGEQGSPRDIFVVAADGSSEVEVVNGPADDTSPVWSVDGDHILFLSSRAGTYGLWAIAIERGKPAGLVLVRPNMGSADPLGVSQTGDFYYANPGGSRMNVYRADLDGEAAAGAPALATEQFVNSNIGPAWSPDGQSIAYYSFRNGNRSTPTVVIRSVTSGEERTVMPSVPIFSPFSAGPQWFPDGGSLMVVARDAQGAGMGFYRLHMNGKVDLLHHADRASSVALSPDGRTIFYAIQTIDAKPNSGRLMRVDIGDGRETVLQRDGWFITVAVSPDGRQLAYVKSLGNGTDSVIETMSVDGGESREIHAGRGWGDGSRYNTLAWTPDQRFLLFVTAGYVPEGPSVLWRVPASGGKPAKVGISMPARIKSPAVRPDGKEITFGAVDNESGEIWKLENALVLPAPKIPTTRQ